MVLSLPQNTIIYCWCFSCLKIKAKAEAAASERHASQLGDRRVTGSCCTIIGHSTHYLQSDLFISKRSTWWLQSDWLMLYNGRSFCSLLIERINIYFDLATLLFPLYASLDSDACEWIFCFQKESRSDAFIHNSPLDWVAKVFNSFCCSSFEGENVQVHWKKIPKELTENI